MGAPNLYLRGNVYWWRAMIHGVTHRKSTGMTDLQMARRKASEFDKAARAGEAGWSSPTIPTFGDWAQAYLDRLTGVAKQRDTACLKDARVFFNGVKLTEIRPSMCVAFVQQQLRANLKSPGTVWLESIRVKHLMQLAVMDKLITENPWRGVKLPKPPQRERILTQTEEARLREAFGADHWASNLLTVALGTGLRRAELMGIRPKHIVDGILRIPAALAKGGKARVVPLRRDVREALNRQVPFETYDAATGLWTPQPLVMDRVFFRYNARYATAIIANTAAKVGLPSLTLHDLRRTFATRAASGALTGKSVPLYHLMQIMGHSTPATTSKYYVWLSEEELMRQMQVSGEKVESTPAEVLKRDLNVDENLA